MDLIFSNGAIWLPFLNGDTILCAERLDCTQPKETPSAFHVTEGPLFSVFNSDISPESVISQSNPGDLKRGSHTDQLQMLRKMNCKVILILLCNVMLVQYEQAVTQLQSCPTESHCFEC